MPSDDPHAPRDANDPRGANVNAKMIRLDQLLKLTNVASSGANAKYIIRDGAVQVNGAVETRRGRKLYVGDVVELQGQTIAIDDALLTRDLASDGPGNTDDE
jgi:ribosome-associated protein